MALVIYSGGLDSTLALLVASIGVVVLSRRPSGK